MNISKIYISWTKQFCAKASVYSIFHTNNLDNSLKVFYLNSNRLNYFYLLLTKKSNEMAARSEENCMSPFRWGDGRVVDYNEISSPSSRGISPCKKLESGDFINGECKNIQQQTPNKTRGTLKRRFSYTCINSRSSSSRSRSSRGNSEENKLRDEPFREKRTRCYSNTSSTGSIETDAIVLARRQKQIDYGKNTAAYDNYIDTVPKSKRTREHPHTPDKYRKYSRRAFDGLIKIWRRQLHVYDPPNLHESTDTDSDTN